MNNKGKWTKNFVQKILRGLLYLHMYNVHFFCTEKMYIIQGILCFRLSLSLACNQIQ